MKKSILIATIATALVTAGCGNAESEVPDAVPATTATATPEAVAVATVPQWASLVAPMAHEWHEQVDTVEDDCLAGPGFPCTAGHLTLSLLAQRYVIVLRGAQENAQHPDYLGEPPAEIARLVEQTVGAAGEVEPAVEAFMDSDCVDPLDLECAAESLTLRRAISGLTSAFDSWAPYL